MNHLDKVIHAEYRRLTHRLTPMGAVTRLAEAYQLHRRRIIKILGADTVGEDLWNDYRMDSYK